ncbi:hypothetical protein I7I50_00923 [Histoplasma capsulatum G186AR]|uniref:Uncharacterized protein n=1 Tax=Ajellomyces capsulatus TaxID=5037 RepID=A0A8H7YK86_AJECA|nr:hypothetical protein I7I52_08189 [Histoplasma capsulatum]QSS72926.1 hypothetical protein I7I50_00923 [Histoplasma capsulatum G186AR]
MVSKLSSYFLSQTHSVSVSLLQSPVYIILFGKIPLRFLANQFIFRHKLHIHCCRRSRGLFGVCSFFVPDIFLLQAWSMGQSVFDQQLGLTSPFQRNKKGCCFAGGRAGSGKSVDTSLLC